ncbi:MAG: hypothetical protein M3373_07635 [Gemmatimonadota bacterium]|nr:hypothetical protein [Gemmatimonadota bacterium]
MLLERRTVSHKTPKDGRLEITEGAAERLRVRVPDGFRLVVNGAEGRGCLAAMVCTCRGAESPHQHWFLESAALTSLAAGGEVAVELREDGVVAVEDR